MLKFLEGRQHQPNPKPTIKKSPYIAFGVSLQAPSNFQNQYSMISPLSYINPFVDMQHTNPKSTSVSKGLKNTIDWIRKTDINQLQEGKIIGSGDLASKPDRYHQLYNTELQKNSSRFRLTKGEFTNYIERTKETNELFGPLIGEERSPQKSLETKRSVLRKSFMHLQTSRQKLQQDKSMRKESSRLLQKMIDERRLVRQSRDKFYVHFKNQMSDRRSPRNNFTLPRIIVDKQPKSSTKRKDFGIFKTLDHSMLKSYIR